MPFTDGAAGRVYYRHWTTPGAPRASVVFLHGFGEHSGLYHRYASELRGHGIDLWALDQYGHGLSDGPRGTLRSLDDAVDSARRLTDLAEAAAPGTPVILAGHSLGSVVALLTALDDTDRYRGVVVSGAPISRLDWSGSDAPTELTLDALSADEFYRDELANDPLSFTEGDLPDLVSRLFPAAWSRFESELPGIGLPVLAVHGAADPIAPIDGVTVWRDRVPTLRVETVDGAHDILNDVEHTRVADLIARFVLDVARTEDAA